MADSRRAERFPDGNLDSGAQSVRRPEPRCVLQRRRVLLIGRVAVRFGNGNSLDLATPRLRELAVRTADADGLCRDTNGGISLARLLQLHRGSVNTSELSRCPAIPRAAGRCGESRNPLDFEGVRWRLTVLGVV